MKKKKVKKSRSPQQDFNDILITLLELSTMGKFEMVNMGDWDMNDLAKNMKPLTNTIDHLKSGKALYDMKDAKSALIALSDAMGTFSTWAHIAGLVIDIRINGQEPRVLKYMLTHTPEEMEADTKKMEESVKQLEEGIKAMEEHTRIRKVKARKSE